jgi:hypothetical protein
MYTDPGISAAEALGCLLTCFFVDVFEYSGGERSYTTICLLLALGESLETPFRILDEFDVILDVQARKLSIEALIRVAKNISPRKVPFQSPPHRPMSSHATDNNRKH